MWMKIISQLWDSQLNQLQHHQRGKFLFSLFCAWRWFIRRTLMLIYLIIIYKETHQQWKEEDRWWREYRNYEKRHRRAACLWCSAIRSFWQVSESYTKCHNCLTHYGNSSSCSDRYLVAARDLSTSEVIIQRFPLVIGPTANDENVPLCLNCYQALKIDCSFQYETRVNICERSDSNCFFIFHVAEQLSGLQVSSLLSQVHRSRSFKGRMPVLQDSQSPQTFALASTQNRAGARLRSNHSSKVGLFKFIRKEKLSTRQRIHLTKLFTSLSFSLSLRFFAMSQDAWC